MQLHEQLPIGLVSTPRIERDLTAVERRKERALGVYNASKAGIYLSERVDFYRGWDSLAHLQRDWQRDGGRYVRTMRWRTPEEVQEDNKEHGGYLFSRGVRVIADEDGRIAVEFIRGFKLMNLWTSVELDRKLRGFSPRTNETLKEEIEYAAESEFSVAGYERPWKEPVRPQLFRIFDRITS
ncbi:MAG TPA: hypothetical protein VJC10_01960 [Patescibacteria group bacterium]|nr:hypothetical protein [Patescibacteria group bacterium]